MPDDQAEHLRRLARDSRTPGASATASPDGKLGPYAVSSHPDATVRGARTIAVTGGKGGVGKTNVAVALALSAARAGQRVGILDADFGLGKIHVLLGLSPKTDLRDVLSGNARLAETLVEGPEGIRLLPGASGLAELANLDATQRGMLLTQMEEIAQQFDLLIIDTAAGIGESVLTFVSACDEAVIVTTPEPTALADAYAVLKVLVARRTDLRLHLVVNSATSRREAMAAADRITDVALRFLQVPITYSGSIPLDPEVAAAVRARRSFVVYAPNSPASVAFHRIAAQLLPTSGVPAVNSKSSAEGAAPRPSAPGFAQRLAALFGLGKKA